jgi:hypothetical protein
MKLLLFVILVIALAGCSSYWQYQAEQREKGELHWEQVEANPNSTAWQKFTALMGKPLNPPPENCKKDAKQSECVRSALAGGAIGAGIAGAGLGANFAAGL